MTEIESGPEPREPGKVELPSEDELAKLPRWAQVAFAARCARRVLPIVNQKSAQVRQFSPTIESAIAVAESLSSAPKSVARTIALRRISEATAIVEEQTSGVIALVADVAAQTARSAIGEVRASLPVKLATEGALVYAHDIADDLGNAAAPQAMTAAFRRDYELLKAVAEREQWTDETPVPPEFFGPVWPDGEPEGWPATNKDEDTGQAALRLHFAIPAEMDREEADRIIQDIIIAANELHLAHGGSGLTITDRIRVYEPALVPAGGDE